MLHHIATISVCYGGHFESKMTAKIQKSSDLGEIWYYYRHDRVKNWALIISCYVLTLFFFIHTTSTCIVRLGDICNALRYSSQYLISVLHPQLPHSYIVCIFYFQLQFLELCICPFQFQVYVHLFESVLRLIDLIILLYYLSNFPVGI